MTTLHILMTLTFLTLTLPTLTSAYDHPDGIFFLCREINEYSMDVLHVSLPNCTTTPCYFEQGRTVPIEVTLKAKRRVTKVRSLFSGVLPQHSRYPIRFMTREDACDYMDRCPVEPQETAHYRDSITLPTGISGKTVYAMLELQGENEEELMCFLIKIVII